MTFPDLVAASLPLLVFAFAGLFSPGPNVVMLTASGARFGFRATLPHLLGVPVGTGMLAAASALGVGSVLLALPMLKLSFQIGAAAWIIWLAWRTAQAGRAPRSADVGKPFTFVQAILFQAVNPKVWAITIAASAGFGIGLPPGAEALRLVLVFAGLNLFVCLFWTGAGQVLSSLLRSDAMWRGFMTVMAAVMASTALLIFL